MVADPSTPFYHIVQPSALVYLYINISPYKKKEGQHPLEDRELMWAYCARWHELIVVRTTHVSGTWHTWERTPSRHRERARTDWVEACPRRGSHRWQKSITTPWSSSTRALSSHALPENRVIWPNKHPVVSIIWEQRRRLEGIARQGIKVSSADLLRVPGRNGER